MENAVIKSLKSTCANKELLAKVVDFLPYPIEIYAPDGTSVFVNKAILNEFHVSDAGEVVGKYNIFQDPMIASSDQVDVLKRAFKGETVFFSDIKVPLEDIVRRYGVKDLDVEAMYQDIAVFPITDEENRVIYVAALLINRRVYRGKDEIEKAKEYLESHWLEEFDLEKTARAACLSKAHFSKLFKKHTGLTPYEYYRNYKIRMLKERLLDLNLTVAQAFAACNMAYNGRSAGSFKAITGLSPSAYRKYNGRSHIDG